MSATAVQTEQAPIGQSPPHPGLYPTTRSPVAFLIDTLVMGGSEKKTVAVSNELARRGLAIHIIYLNGPDTLVDSVDSAIPVLCLGRSGKLSIPAARGLSAYLARHDIGRILCVNLYPMVYAVAAQIMLRPRSLVFDVLINVTDFVALKHHVQMLLYRCLFPRADRVIFGCESQMTQWRTRYRLGGLRCSYLHNGVDVDWYSRSALPGTSLAIRSECGLRASSFVIGSVGRLQKEKNQAELIRAARRLVDHGIDVQALIVGDGPERTPLEGLATALGLSERVVFLGRLNDVRTALAAMDVFVLPSLAVETFSNAALEAMAMGCPVVLSDIGGAREMVSDGDNGYVYRRGHAEGLDKALTLLYTDATLRKSLACAGRATVETRFSFSGMVDRYERLLVPA
jgi:glycosyltransferase involved in cell wall biosynthesis